MSSGYSEEDIRRAAEIREWLIKEISDKQEEVERLRTTLSIIDNLLKQGSFKAAGKSRLWCRHVYSSWIHDSSYNSAGPTANSPSSRTTAAGSNNNRERPPHLL